MTVRAPRPLRVPDPKYMTFVEHLQELRQRLVVSLLAIALGSVVGWFLFHPVIGLLEAPIHHYIHGPNSKLWVTDIYGIFTLQLKIAVMTGFILALPVTIYEMWAFVAPAFGPAPNRWGPLWITSALTLFAAGGVTGYLVIPLAIRFFSGFQSSGIGLLLVASNFVNFIALVLIIFGISFELPLVLVSLSAIGITSSRWLASKRAFFFFGIFIFTTIVTPGADWISPLILGAILYVLFEASIAISRLLGK